jgi:hypothetical protein
MLVMFICLLGVWHWGCAGSNGDDLSQGFVQGHTVMCHTERGMVMPIT